MGPGPSIGGGGGPPNVGGGGGGGGGVSAPFPYNIPPNPMAPPGNNGPCPSMGNPSASTSSSSNEKKDMNYNTAFNSAFIQEESGGGYSGRDNVPADANIPPPSYDSLSPDDNLAESNKPKPQPRSKMLPGNNNNNNPNDSVMPDLPNVPLDLPDIPDDTNNEEIDFDDLSRRFEELKKRK